MVLLIIAKEKKRTTEERERVKREIKEKRREREKERKRLFYGCSYMFHLSGNNRRDSHFMGS